MNKMPDKIKELFHPKNMTKDKLFIGLLAGLLLFVAALPTSSGTKGEGGQGSSGMGQTGTQDRSGESAADSTVYEKELERRLEAVLGAIEGVGRVKVMITLQDTGEAVVEKDTPRTSNTQEETGSGGESRKSVQIQTEEKTVYGEGGTAGVPYVVKQLRPGVEGVLVIAEGGGEPLVAQNISEAVLALFHIEAHKIKVVKMNQTGG